MNVLRCTIQVAYIFSTAPKLQPLHSKFISCNDPTKDTQWCLKCEKCAFVFLIMSAYMVPSKVWAIFNNTNLFTLQEEEAKSSRTESSPTAKTMDQHFLSLIGHGSGADVGIDTSTDEGCMKPFECVGTFWESGAAVELALYRYIENILGLLSTTLSCETCQEKMTLDCHNLPLVLSRVPPILTQLCDTLQVFPMLTSKFPATITSAIDDSDHGECDNYSVKQLASMNVYLAMPLENRSAAMIKKYRLQ
jgi:hypothetical protein